MTGLVFGKDQSALNLRLSVVAGGKTTSAELKQRGLIVGTPVEVVDQLQALAEAGVQGVMLQWLELDDLAGLEDLAGNVLPKFIHP